MKKLNIVKTLEKWLFHVVKYLRDSHPELGLKEAKIYYDLYFDN